MKKETRLGRAILSMSAVGALAVCSGCASIMSSKPGALDGVTVKGAGGPVAEVVYLEADGGYVLCSLPIASGKFVWNEETKQLETTTVFFEDCVGITEVQEALQKYAESKNCVLAEVSFTDSDAFLADASCYEGMIGTLFSSSSMGVSAVLVPRNDETKE